MAPKRKQIYSAPGICTRSKSQIYVRNRSDDVRRQLARTVRKQESPDVMCSASVKDIRVITPVSDLQLDYSSEIAANIRSNPDTDNGVLMKVDSPSEIQIGPNHSLETENGIANQSSISGSTVVTNLQKRSKLYRAPTSFSYRRLQPYLKAAEEDSSNFSKIEVVDIGTRGKRINLAFENPILDSNGECGENQLPNPSLEAENGMANQSSVSGTGSNPVTNLPKPRKLYGTPTSFSYRRLLPYLKAAEEDSSGYQKIEVVDIGQRGKPITLDFKNPKLDLNGESCVVNKYDNCVIGDVELGKDVGVNIIANCESPNIKGGSPCLSEMDGNMKLNNAGPENYEGCRTDEINDLMEECEQVTPPDAVFGKSGLVNTWQTETTVTRSVHGAESFKDQLIGSSSICKMVLKPCSRVKVFKTPSSLSYRRLLPFLKDIAKDNSSAMITNQIPEAESNLKQNPSMSIQVSSPEDILVERSETDYKYSQNSVRGKDRNVPAPLANAVCDSSTTTNSSPPDPLLSSCDTNNSKETVLSSSVSRIKSQMPDEPKETVILSSLSSTEPHMTNVSRCELQSQHVMPEEYTEKEQETPQNTVQNGYQENCLAVPLGHTVNRENFQNECAELVKDDRLNVCSQQQADLSNNELKSITAGIKQDLMQIDACSSGVHHDRLRKGILKRNSQGCRGLCNCLNCASFRLHAERAFEFSRNQLQDAEDVALDLVMEIADIRNILQQQTAVDASNQVILQRDQVKEICKKALETEEQAKKRLSQMHEDLNCHCRNRSLERPGVEFAENVEEIIIPSSRLPRR